ncbi:hypothetical protein ANRL3_02272 [Anaerolineae bacterium]|nr:hypothetical protein ANRL3_02272 [Anaerolineae bacterium]
MTKQTFQATLQTEDDSTFVVIPFDVKAVFGAGRPPVRVTINGCEFRSTLAPYGGTHYLGLNQTVRKAASIKAGDTITVTLELDESPRVVAAPADLAQALNANPAAQARWDKLSYSHRKEYVAAIEEAKKPETRARRIAKAIEQLAAELEK